MVWVTADNLDPPPPLEYQTSEAHARQPGTVVATSRHCRLTTTIYLTTPPVLVHSNSVTMSERKRKWDSGPDGSPSTKAKTEELPSGAAPAEANGAADAAGQTVISSTHWLQLSFKSLNMSSQKNVYVLTFAFTYHSGDCG